MIRKEEAEKKAKEAEEKKKRLEEAEAKRQQMLEAQKENNVATYNLFFIFNFNWKGSLAQNKVFR